MGYISGLRKIVGQRTLINTGGRVLIENKKGEILLIRRKDNGQWGFPAGGLEIGESIRESIIREAKEETGLEILELQLIGVSSDPKIETVRYPNGDQVQNMSLVFYSNMYKGELLSITDETVDAKFFPLSELPGILSNEAPTIQFYKKFKSTGTVHVN